MTVEEMKKRKDELRYTYEMIAERSGLPLSTVQKILCGVTKKPRRATILALEKALKMTDGEEYSGRISSGIVSVNEEAEDYKALSEPAAAPAKVIRSRDIETFDRWFATEKPSKRWPRQGEYTASDYFALPDDIRVELIDGFIYDMASPTYIHQFIQFELGSEFRRCVEEHEKHCLIFLAPFDIAIDGDDRTIVQPDLLIMCEKDSLEDMQEDTRAKEVPDLIAEILSPSTRDRDCTIKLRKYMNAGVKEYWIVDPKNEKLLVYVFDEDLLPTQYSFEDSVPVGISGGECSIEFSRIAARLSDIRSWNLPGVDLS